jgi:uncharacterized protein (DUF2062 family)/SAM-dependent methyltransferase
MSEQAREDHPVSRRFQTHVKRLATVLLKEQLEPGRAAAAVFVGIFIGIVPIYGFQTLAALGLAVLFKLNKPLTFAATFINNPVLLPALVVSSIEAGCFLLTGRFQPWKLSAFTMAHAKEELLFWAVGSVVVGVIVGAVGAAITAIVVHLNTAAARALREQFRFVNQTYVGCPSFDRGFVRWKLRLDRIFGLIAEESLGTGTVVDLGCGYGMALCFAAYGDRGRRLVGCDLDEHRIATAREAMRNMNAEVSVADVRKFELPSASLILILDVLQYLPAEEQLELLRRCCAALEPGGKFIFRVHDCERGVWSAITMAFDRLIFLTGHAGVKPLMLAPERYQGALEDSGMQVESRRFRNRLPLAHILFIARKPLLEKLP